MYFDDIVFDDRPVTLGGDLNGDSKVNLADLSIFAGQWLDESCYGIGCADFDRVGREVLEVDTSAVEFKIEDQVSSKQEPAKRGKEQVFLL